MTTAQINLFRLYFNDMQGRVYATAGEHGWYDADAPAFNDGEKIALMHSELSEALDALRHGNPPSDHIPEFSGVEEELADTIIRIMDYAQHKGLRVAEALIAKAAFNDARPYRHGGKRF